MIRHRSFHSHRTASRRESTSARWQYATLRFLIGAIWFIYLYSYEAPILILCQHRLSEGQTSYSPLWGAVLLTTLALLLQGTIAKWFRPRRGTYLISALPSVAGLLLLTAFTPSISWWSIALIFGCLFTFILGIWYIRHLHTGMPHTNHPRHITPWLHHIGWLLAISFILGCGAHSTDITDYEIRTSEYLLQRQPAKALTIGKQSLTTSPRLLALRAYALAQPADTLFTQLPERLLDFPIPEVPSSHSLLLQPSDYAFVRFPADSIYLSLGRRPRQDENEITYLQRMAVRPHSNTANRVRARDYLLCTRLLNRQLDAFAADFQRLVPLSDSTIHLPRLYRQALFLYSRLHTQPILSWSEANTEAHYEEFRAVERQTTDSLVRPAILRNDYGDTYWWYYYYGGKH